jgi:damage-control phosphatase, subfamily I
MNTHVDCIACIVKKADKLADKYIKDKRQKYNFMKQVLEVIIDTDYDRSSPIIDAKFFRIAKKELGVEDIYKEEKKFFNDKLLSMEEKIEAMLEGAQDRLFHSLKVASAGNIIDFSALDNIDINFVKAIINETVEKYFNKELFIRLKTDLKGAQSLLYLGDNTGEIVLDKIFIKEISRQYPQLRITFATRGKPIFNDVTEEDAYYVGMDRYAKILHNGADLPGTDLREVSLEFKEYFDAADVVIAKGQGNFESLSGCGKNIYYLFLCKCDMMIQKLSADRFSNMFINELNSEA